MSALNWALLSATAQPLALPAEKFVLAPIQHVALSLVPTVPGQPLQAKLPSGPQPHERTATGTLHVSNQRLVFVGPPGAIHTLSIPYSALHDGRFVRPPAHSEGRSDGRPCAGAAHLLLVVLRGAHPPCT